MWPRVRPWAGRRKTAEQIMNDYAEWATWYMTAWDCHCAIYFTADNADRDESVVLLEDTLRAQDIMGEVMK